MQSVMNYQMADIKVIRPGKFNPRKRFDGPEFDELVKSIKQKGVLEPLLVRPIKEEKKKAGKKKAGKGKKTKPEDNKKTLEIVAGARRYHAACIAADQDGGRKKYELPVLVKEMDDDEAIEIMTIENLQRKDLTELEEAEGFKLYLDRHPGEFAQLAEKTGINERYIHRRIAVLNLPKIALQEWDKGNLLYGHLEQFLRLTDKNEIENYVKEIKRWNGGFSVHRLKDDINNKAIKLGSARFSTKEQGCAKCMSNTDMQKSLLDLDGLKGARCLNLVCFREAQRKFLTEHWKETDYYKQYKTNGFRFHDEIDFGKYENYENLYGKINKKCKQCNNFITMLYINGSVIIEKACLDKACLAKQRSTKTQTITQSQEDKAERRAKEHGVFFREEFYKEQLPMRLKSFISDSLITDDLEKDTRIKLFAFIKSRHTLRSWFSENAVNEDDDRYGYMDNDEIWKILCLWDMKTLQKYTDDALIYMIMEQEFGADARRMVADHIGISLQDEWRITKEYLEKKTITEIRAIAEKFGLFERQEVKTFLYEVLLKKRGNFASCKKSELIRIFLESGTPLAWVVPDEILKDENSTSNGEPADTKAMVDKHSTSNGNQKIEDSDDATAQRDGMPF